MKLDEIREIMTLLSDASLSDPFLALCNALAWLDPLVDQDALFDPDDYGAYDDWSNIGAAWEIAQRCFPEVYAETTLALRSGMNEQPLADQVCEGINRHIVGGELHDLAQIHFGLPFFGRGIDPAHPDSFDDPARTPLREVFTMMSVPAGEGYL